MRPADSYEANKSKKHKRGNFIKKGNSAQSMPEFPFFVDLGSQTKLKVSQTKPKVPQTI